MTAAARSPGSPRTARPARGTPARSASAHRATARGRASPARTATAGADDFDGRPWSSGEIFTPGRGRPGGPPDGLDGLRSGALLRWLGTMSTLTAALVLIGATVAGVVLTVIAGMEPGNLLGFFVIVGSLAAVLGVRRGAVYLFFPTPALAFFVAAVAAGIVHDRQDASSTAGLAAHFTQWVAGIFWPAVVATILVLLVGGGRWLLKKPLVTGHSLPSAGRPAAPGRCAAHRASAVPSIPGPATPSSMVAPRAQEPARHRDREPGRPRSRAPGRPRGREPGQPRDREPARPRSRKPAQPRGKEQARPRSRAAAPGGAPQRIPPRPRTPRPAYRPGPLGRPPAAPRPQPAHRPAAASLRPPGLPAAAARPATGQTEPGPSFNPAPGRPRRQPPDGWTQR